MATLRSYSWMGPMSSVLAGQAGRVSVTDPEPPCNGANGRLGYALFSTVAAATAETLLLCPAAKVAGRTTRGAGRARRLAACGSREE